MKIYLLNFRLVTQRRSMGVSVWRDICRLAALLALLTSTGAAQKKRKPVSSALTAKWRQTPFVLEVR